jgi:hypothetical protein
VKGGIQLKKKIISLIIILVLMLPFIAETASVTLVTQSYNGSPRSITQDKIPEDETNSQVTVLQIGDITLTFDVKEPAKRTFITLQGENTKVTEEVIVTPSSEGFTTSIYIDGRLFGISVKDVNILEPVQLTTASIDSLSTESQSPSYRASYTYEWWDSIRYVTGPTYQIKYPHPDRDYYQIAPWNPWEGTGTQLFHTQFNQLYSGLIAGVGWTGLCTAIGAYIGYRSSTNVYATVIGAVLGAVIGLYLQFATEAILLDEEGCMWWWSSRAMDNWLAANAWWIWFFNLTGGANPFVWAAFVLYGYLRIGDTTFYDAINAGSP